MCDFSLGFDDQELKIATNNASAGVIYVHSRSAVKIQIGSLYQ